MKITNTLSGKKEALTTLQSNKVKLYVCGVTPYDYAHIGHGRVYVTFDVLYRLLKYFGFDVIYCRNFTDIDDKLLSRAEKEFGDQMRYKEIAQRYIDEFGQDIKNLNCLQPSYEPRVTETIPEIIAFVQGLIAAGKAYEVEGDVYYSVRSFPSYGKLSKRNIDDLCAGARVEIDERKRDPLDFALWKSEKEGTFWQSPWGFGRPGWHIECSAMAEKFLGPQIDLHAGGMDLIFPHHENEIAQSEGLHGKTFAQFWMHNAFVRINQEKMSKSLGNFFTLRDVFLKFDPMVVRFYYLNHYYRAPLDFSFEDLEMVQKSYQRLCKIFAHQLPSVDLVIVKSNQTVKAMLAFLEDDLNTPGMLGVLFENLPSLQKDPIALAAVKYFMQHVLGLSLQPLPEKELVITEEIQELLKARDEARKNKEWTKADVLRDKLKALGYEAQDKKV